MSLRSYGRDAGHACPGELFFDSLRLLDKARRGGVFIFEFYMKVLTGLAPHGNPARESVFGQQEKQRPHGKELPEFFAKGFAREDVFHLVE